MILAYYGKWIPLEQIHRDCGVSKDGSNAKNILVAFRCHSLIAQGFRVNGSFPMVAKSTGSSPAALRTLR